MTNRNTERFAVLFTKDIQTTEIPVQLTKEAIALVSGSKCTEMRRKPNSIIFHVLQRQIRAVSLYISMQFLGQLAWRTILWGSAQGTLKKSG